MVTKFCMTCTLMKATLSQAVEALRLAMCIQHSIYKGCLLLTIAWRMQKKNSSISRRSTHGPCWPMTQQHHSQTVGRSESETGFHTSPTSILLLKYL